MGEVSKEEYAKNLSEIIRNLVECLKNKGYKPKPTLWVYIPKANGKKRPLGNASYEDKIVQLGLKKILVVVYEPRVDTEICWVLYKRPKHTLAD